jgi:hypothetical protein
MSQLFRFCRVEDALEGHLRKNQLPNLLPAIPMIACRHAFSDAYLRDLAVDQRSAELFLVRRVIRGMFCVEGEQM